MNNQVLNVQEKLAMVAFAYQLMQAMLNELVLLGSFPPVMFSVSYKVYS